jgi:guanylate kinase
METRSNSRQFVFNVSGPYAVGKDTILNELISTFGERVYRVRTITTRPVTQKADPTYEQVTPDEFERRVARGRWNKNYQLSGLTAYATSIDEIEAVAKMGRICILSVYAAPEGAGHLREVFGKQLRSLALLPGHGAADEQLQILRGRILSRNRDDPKAIEARLQHQMQPLQYVLDNPSVMTSDGSMKVFDNILVNESLEITVQHSVRLFEDAFFGGAK